MTGAVPYYGGRFSPAQAYGISSDCATTDICGSDDERSLRTRAVSTPSQPAEPVRQRKPRVTPSWRCSAPGRGVITSEEFRS
jgi:hypothetical protein